MQLDSRGFRLPSKEWFEERFIPEPNTGCWLWERSCGGGGYGIIWKYMRRPGRYAHRVAYELYVGPIPEGVEVCHKCDTMLCVNPRHLELGTHQKNIADAYKRRRISTMRLVTAFGRTQSIAEWSRETGVGSRTIRGRLERGWAPKYAITVVRGPGGWHGDEQYLLRAS